MIKTINQIILIICLVGVSAVHAQAPPNSVQSVRIWHSPNNTRIVFDVFAGVQQSIFMLQNPRRLVVDIQNARLDKALPALDVTNKHIAAIRSGTPQQGTLRFVFELKMDLLLSDFVLPPNELYGHRLVIDLNEKLIAAPAPANDNPTAVVIADPQPRGPLVVAIDAGHGGEDPGAIGYSGTHEKKLTLAIAKRLKKRIDKDKRMRAVLIRSGDYFIKLHKRRNDARLQGADVFISIHADGFTRSSPSGFSVYALSPKGATSVMARALAAKENAADKIGGVDVTDKDPLLTEVLFDLSITNTISESVALGGRVLFELSKLGKLHRRRVEQAGFAVLKSPDIPSILIETGFITNPKDERLLKTARYQKKIVNAIYTAVADYSAQRPHLQASNYNSQKNSPQKDSPQKDSPQKDSPQKDSPQTPDSEQQSDEQNTAAPRFHVVKRGDSLSKISALYNVTIKSLKRSNNIKRNTVYVGQKLILPEGARAIAKTIIYQVRGGDNLTVIAQKYNVTIDAIMALNKLSTPTIFVGQRIKIP